MIGQITVYISTSRVSTQIRAHRVSMATGPPILPHHTHQGVVHGQFQPRGFDLLLVLLYQQLHKDEKSRMHRSR